MVDKKLDLEIKKLLNKESKNYVRKLIQDSWEKVKKMHPAPWD